MVSGMGVWMCLLLAAVRKRVREALAQASSSALRATPFVSVEHYPLHAECSLDRPAACMGSVTPI